MCSGSHLGWHVLDKTTFFSFWGTEYDTLVSNHSDQGFCCYRRRKNVTDGWTDRQTDRGTGEKHICLQPIGRRHNKSTTVWLTTSPVIGLPSHELPSCLKDTIWEWDSASWLSHPVNWYMKEMYFKISIWYEPVHANFL